MRSTACYRDLERTVARRDRDSAAPRAWQTRRDMPRDTKKTTGAQRRTRTTRRGVATPDEIADDDEPAFSIKPTRRDLAPVAEPGERRPTPRGQFSIASVHNIPSDAIAGLIDSAARSERRGRRTKPPIARVELVSVTTLEITVAIDGERLTLERNDALALVRIITSAFAT